VSNTNPHPLMAGQGQCCRRRSPPKELPALTSLFLFHSLSRPSAPLISFLLTNTRHSFHSLLPEASSSSTALQLPHSSSCAGHTRSGSHAAEPYCRALNRNRSSPIELWHASGNAADEFFFPLSVRLGDGCSLLLGWWNSLGSDGNCFGILFSIVQVEDVSDKAISVSESSIWWRKWKKMKDGWKREVRKMVREWVATMCSWKCERMSACVRVNGERI